MERQVVGIDLSCHSHRKGQSFRERFELGRREGRLLHPDRTPNLSR